MYIIVIIVTALLISVCFLFFRNRHSYQVTSASVTTLVREIPMKLVTNTVTTMVYCTIEDIPEGATSKIRDTILGKSEGIFIAKVKYLYGIDLKEMGEDDVTIDQQYITVRLPDPKMIDDPIIDWNYTFQTKRPVTRAIWDVFAGVNIEKEMRSAFQTKARVFAKDNGLEPTKEEIIKILEPFFNKLIATQSDKRFVFQ
jgi:ferredoxin-fold anticodon binding domain-containing protein